VRAALVIRYSCVDGAIKAGAWPIVTENEESGLWSSEGLAPQLVVNHHHYLHGCCMPSAELDPAHSADRLSRRRDRVTPSDR